MTTTVTTATGTNKQQQETDITKELLSQFQAFMDDEDLAKSYRYFKPRKGEALIQLFRYVPKLTAVKKQIHVPDKYGNFKPYALVVESRYYPIAKVISSGIEDVKAGEFYTVPVDEVYGEDYNPKFLQLYQYSEVKGAKPMVPPGMQETIPNIDKFWGRYKFMIPWMREEDQNEDFFYVPSPLLKMKFEREQLRHPN